MREVKEEIFKGLLKRPSTGSKGEMGKKRDERRSRRRRVKARGERR